MHKYLIIKAFEKAEKEVGSKKSTYLAKHLSDYIFEKSGEQYGEKSLRTYYSVAKRKSKDNVEFKHFVKQSLCKYLGYGTFEDFEVANVQLKLKKNKKFNERLKILIKENKVTIFVSFVIIIGLLIIIPLKQQQWMVWKEDHYEKTSFNLKKYDISQLKLYKVEWVNSFKQITPYCGVTKFFKENGNANLWYGKSENGELEYFTHYGLHPETGKTLKPITQYMMGKYICN